MSGVMLVTCCPNTCVVPIRLIPSGTRASKMRRATRNLACGKEGMRPPDFREREPFGRERRGTVKLVRRSIGGMAQFYIRVGRDVSIVLLSVGPEWPLLTSYQRRQSKEVAAERRRNIIPSNATQKAKS